MENNFDNYDLNNLEQKNPYSFQEQKINAPNESGLNQFGQDMSSAYSNQNPYLDNPYFDQGVYQNQNPNNGWNSSGQMMNGGSYTTYNTSGMTKDQGQQKGTSSLVMGIISIVFSFSGGFFSLIFAIIGLKLAKDAKKLNNGVSEGTTTAGFICSLIGLIISSIILIGIIVMFILAFIYG